MAEQWKGVDAEMVKFYGTMEDPDDLAALLRRAVAHGVRMAEHLIAPPGNPKGNLRGFDAAVAIRKLADEVERGEIREAAK
jgi:hypothetical protein